MTEKSVLPTQEEHNATIRKVWHVGFYIAGACFTFMLAVVAVMLSMHKTPAEIVSVELLVVYIILPAYAFGFVAPMLASSLIKMTLAVDMSREGLEIGKETASSMTEFKNETKPLIEDAKTIIAEVKPMVGEVRTAVHDGKKIFDDVLTEFREGNGKIENRITKIIRKVLDEARDSVKDAEGELEKLIWTKVDKFLATVFDGKDTVDGGPVEAPIEEPKGEEVVH
jgi:polyhydroxyalkanoate synthesis regulator phasin